jgi:hypothetical protein
MVRYRRDQMKIIGLRLIKLSLLMVGGFLVAAPPNDHFANRINLSGGLVAVDGTTVDATLETGEPQLGMFVISSVWYNWTAPMDGNLRIQLLNTGNYRLGQMYAGTTLTQLQYVVGFSYNSEANVDVQAGWTYQFRVVTEQPWAPPPLVDGPFTLRLGYNSAPANDHFTNRIRITNAVERISFRNVLATLEPGEISETFGAGNSVWYEWRAPTNGIAHVLVDNSHNTWVGIYSGSAGPSVMITNSHIGGGHCWQEVTFDAVSGQHYHLAFDNSGAVLPGDRAATLTLNGAALLGLPTRRTNGVSDLRVFGERYRYYAFEVSTDLANWSALSTNIHNYVLFFQDTNTVSSLSRFYRVRLVEP